MYTAVNLEHEQRGPEIVEFKIKRGEGLRILFFKLSELPYLNITLLMKNKGGLRPLPALKKLRQCMYINVSDHHVWFAQCF